MRILKFGGTSVLDAQRIEQVSRIVRDHVGHEPVAVVVSALGGVTNLLVELADSTSREFSESSLVPKLEALEERHLEIARQVASAADEADLVSQLKGILADLGNVARGALLVGECTPRTRDRILSTGELASSLLVAAQLRRDGLAAAACDARRLVVTDERFGNAFVHLEPTNRKIVRHFQAKATAAPDSTPEIQVVTGFLGATRSGATTTLGRGGSDYTAALLGGALSASAIEIWTDVDGVMSADPRRVPSAVSRQQLSFEELMELAHFGAKVVYPPTVQPARAAGIPLVIRNTLHPEHPGTEVRDGLSGSSPAHPLAGVTSTGPVTVFRLEGPGMVGIPGFAGRLFHALAQSDISVILITQASSEHSISFATAPGLTDAVCRCVHREFERERKAGALYDLAVSERVCVVAAVGEGMAERPGIAARIFGALRHAGVNVRAIAQGSSERNISTVVDLCDEARALRAIHDAFFANTLPRPLVQQISAPLRVYLAGTGGVGGALLGLIERLPSPLALHGLANSRCFLVGDPQPLAGSTAQLLEQLNTTGNPGGGASMAEHLLALPAGGDPPRVLVDCTASVQLAECHGALLRSGCSVVTANKLAVAGQSTLAEPLRPHFEAQRSSGPVYRCEATVGAGLPILTTLDDLLVSGDEVHGIEGVFSGTLALVLARLRSGSSLSDAVREAHLGGFTEPDPRQDLSGQDVARKLLIMVRRIGRRIEPRDLAVNPLVEGDDLGGDLGSFWGALPHHDGALSQRLQQARDQHRELAYLASWDAATGLARVGMSEVPADHPAAALRGTDNLFLLRTKRCPQGIVIQGPGAGAEVTAAAVFGDLLRAAGELVHDSAVFAREVHPS